MRLINGMNRVIATILGSLALMTSVNAQNVIAREDSLVQDSIANRMLQNVTVVARQSSRSRLQVMNTEIIGKGELQRAACCNLGESFTTNPSVDVSYSDAATGARQIKLLGLSGTYVQMLTENMPNLRGASLPYSLGYVPGPWMQSIQVSKGASSVKNGYESITGQINVEYIKPQGIDGVRAGDIATVFGSDGGATLPAEKLVEFAGTISYEIITRIGRRVPRVFIGETK